jgi:long-chain acyl-CoA synthetase
VGVRLHLASLVDDFTKRHRDIAIVAHRGNRRFATTYGELRELAGRFSAELARRGIAPGDRIVLWGDNSAEWIACFFGCILRGVVAVPLDAAGAPDFAARVIADVSPKLIVGDAKRLTSLTKHGQFTTYNSQLIDLANLRTELPPEPVFAVSAAITADTPFQIVFTSGTTSEPRGIVHTHRNVIASLAPIEREMQKYLRYERWVHPLRFLHSLPLSHVFGQFMGLWIPPLLGAELHFAEALEASRTVELIRRERISVLIAVPRVLQLLRAHLLARFPGLAEDIQVSEGYKLYKRWWRFRHVHRTFGWKFWAVISGGATLPGELETFWNSLGYALIQGYGMTETSALVTLNHPFKIKQGTIGKPLPGREVRITPEGEILVRGPMLATATWQGGAMRPRDSEWLATGDLAEQSPTGELRFLGRKGDVIVTAAGLNIHPADLEAALQRQPGVRACTVVPCDTAAGPEPVCVVIFSGAEAELQRAVDAANRTLAEYQQIRRVLRWPELQLPYTSTGKLLRRQVAQWACAALAHRTDLAPASSDTLLPLIAEITGEASPAKGAQSTDALRLSEDLHLDSLGRVQLQTLIEQRLSVELDDDAIAAVTAVGQLRKLIEHQLGGPSVTREGAESQAVPVVRQQPSAILVDEAGDRGSESYPRWPWTPSIRILRAVFIEGVMRPLVALLAAPRIVREEGTYPERPFLIIANHVTAYDGALILYALPAPLRRRVAAAMSGEMLLDLRLGHNQGNWFVNLVAPIGYWLVTALFNVFPLPRARGFRRSFSHAGEAMDRGYSVLIFPEGTRSRDGRMHAFRPGIGLLARDSAVPVLPIALAGLGELRVAGQGWLRSGKLTIRIGKLIQPSATEDPNELTRQLEGAVRDLLGQ